MSQLREKIIEHSLNVQMVSERQRIEAPTTPSSTDNMPPPPSYEEANGVFASSHMHATPTDSMSYFLGEVCYSAFNVIYGFCFFLSQMSDTFLCELKLCVLTDSKSFK